MPQFKKGIFIGKFYPLHLGHLATLQKLAKEVEEAYLIFYYDEEAELKLAAQLGADYDIQQRVQDAQEAVEAIKNVMVIALAIPPETQFPRDFLEIKAMVEKEIGGQADVQIFGGEEVATYLPYKYTDAYLLGPPYDVEDEKGSNTSLHATAIRKNYPFYKSHLPPAVRETLDDLLQ